ncbi:OLC1v1013540C1 [Oldenlandia corymbosa var. corymbosa]|uniref:OLC1v1013540C1 n=1 Tax=Oldenlandia corymbosa var. corymbosa TaxID=529605 RepID=A0AAV1DYI4_OLDCO|nr:OLC1v1013540C1 [Oldenlandia corymbosa var. corymbosa]
MRKLDILASVAAEAYEEERRQRRLENRAAESVRNWGCTSKRSEFRNRHRTSKTIPLSGGNDYHLLPGTSGLKDNDHLLLPGISGMDSKPRKVMAIKFTLKKNQVGINGTEHNVDDTPRKIEKDTVKTEKPEGIHANFMAGIPSLNLPFKKRIRFEDNCPEFTIKKRKTGHDHHHKVTEIPTLDLNKPPKIKKDNGPHPPPDLPVGYRNKILERAGNREVGKTVLVIQKRLTKTDLQGNQNRFSIPKRKIKNEFLNNPDKELLKQRDEDGHCKVLTLEVIEPQDRVESVNLRRWLMNKEHGKPSVSYVLNGDGWKNIRDGNNFQIGNLVQLWSVELDKRPCLIFVKLEQN